MRMIIREATLADSQRIVAILNSQIAEPVTVEEYIRQEEARPQDEPYLRVVAENEEGEIVGWGVAVHESSNRPGEWFVRARVEAPYQGQGVGEALYQHLCRHVRKAGATRLETNVREEDLTSVAWAQRRGFQTEYHLFESTRTLSDWDPAPFQEAVEKARVQGFRFATLAELTADMEKKAAYRRYFEFFLPMVQDIPGNQDRPETPFDEWYGYVKDDPDWRPEHVLIAVQGEQWAAVAHLKRVASGALYNDFTGVARDFRSRGLTLALKVEALTLAQQLDAPYIRTNNLSVNPRILAVNERLGYVPTPGHYLMAKALV